MCQNLQYVLHSFQFKQIKKNASEIKSLILNSSKKIFLYGLEAVPKRSEKKYPIAVLFHGYTSNYRRVAYIANMLLRKGIAVFLINLRGHGKSSGNKKDVNGMQQDIAFIIDYIKSRKIYDENRILMLGISLGALITLTAGYNHPDITHLIALAGISSPTDLLRGMTAFRRWRWKVLGKLGGLDILSMIGKKQYTPKIQTSTSYKYKRILLLHCKNDALVAVNNFWINVTAFRLNPEDYAIFPNGAHSFSLIKNQVLDAIDQWLHNNEFYRAE